MSATSVFRAVAPRLHRAHASEQARRMDGISRCYDGGWHVDGAGPCCDTIDQAIRYRNREDRVLLARLGRRELPQYPEARRNQILYRLGERATP